MNNKRKIDEEDVEDQSASKRHSFDEQTQAKVRQIIQTNFEDEINYKRNELDKISQRIIEGQNMLDKLRALAICRYFSLHGRLAPHEYVHHPAILKLQREKVEAMNALDTPASIQSTIQSIHSNHQITSSSSSLPTLISNQIDDFNLKHHKIKLSVGNVSCSIDRTKSSNLDSQITHKWMCYVRSENCKNIDTYLKKVVFYLHSSYKPNDMVEIKKAPFRLYRHGWGEFPIHVQMHFKDSRNKRVDIIHALKLDWTCTGKQKYSGETSAQVDLLISSYDYIEEQPKADAIKEQVLEQQTVIVEQAQQKNDDKVVELEDLLSYPASEFLNASGLEELIDLYTNSNSCFETNNNAANQNDSNSCFLDSITQLIEQDTSSSKVEFSTVHIDDSSQSSNTSSALQETRKEITKSSIDDLLSLRPKVPLKVTPVVTPLNSPMIKNEPKLTSCRPNTCKKTQFKVQVKPKIEIFTCAKSTSSPQSLKKCQPQITPVVKSDSKSNKKCVIYKIESNDIKPVISASMPLIKPTTTSTSMTTIVPFPNGNSKMPLNRSHKSANSLLNDHNNCLPHSKIHTGKSPVKITPANRTLPSIQFTNHKIVDTLSIDSQAKSQSKQPLTQEIYKINESHIQSASKFESYEECIKRALKLCPIITLAKSNLSFSAQSIKEWYAWPYAKRRANEWMRALSVKKKCDQQMVSHEKWSTKRVLTWLRSHGHTPLEYDISRDGYDDHEKVQNGYVSSLTPYDNLLLKEIGNFKLKKVDNNDYIDVDNDDVQEKNQDKLSRRENDYYTDVYNYDQIVATSDGAKYIREQLDLLGLKTQPVLLTQNIACNLIEEFLFTICKQFCNDIIRATCSDIYTNGVNVDKRSSSVHHFPYELNVLDIYKTLSTHSKYDFLTNKFMAYSSSSCVPTSTSSSSCSFISESKIK